MSKPVLAAQLYTIRQFVKDIEGVRESLKKVRDIGYTAVQISGFGPVDPAEVARIVEDLDINIAATHMSWDRFLNDLDGVIVDHKLWKCTHSAIGGLFTDEYKCAAGVNRFLGEFETVVERLSLIHI